VGNGRFGVALAQLDSQLIECGRIHAEKNTFGERPENTRLYACLFNNWLYGHAWAPGPLRMNLRYRLRDYQSCRQVLGRGPSRALRSG
jgi:hypothetical protein